MLGVVVVVVVFLLATVVVFLLTVVVSQTLGKLVVASAVMAWSLTNQCYDLRKAYKTARLRFVTFHQTRILSLP